MACCSQACAIDDTSYSKFRIALKDSCEERTIALVVD